MINPQQKDEIAVKMYGIPFARCDASQRQQVIFKIKDSNSQTNFVTFAPPRPDIKEVIAKRNEYLKELEQKEADKNAKQDLFATKRAEWLEQKRTEAELKTLYLTNRGEWAEKMKEIYLAKIVKGG